MKYFVTLKALGCAEENNLKKKKKAKQKCHQFLSKTEER